MRPPHRGWPGLALDLHGHAVKGLEETAVALVDEAMAKALHARSGGARSRRVQDGRAGRAPRDFKTWRLQDSDHVASGYATACKIRMRPSRPVPGHPDRTHRVRPYSRFKSFSSAIAPPRVAGCGGKTRHDRRPPRN